MFMSNAPRNTKGSPTPFGTRPTTPVATPQTECICEKKESK
jgi:hypothetical protein